MQIDDAMQEQARALADPSRFRIFRFIVDTPDPVGVAELTELLGFNHNAIRQHLSVLTAAGLIAEFDEVRTTRGRPRKQYEARSDALHAFRSVAGSYERLAALLLDLHVSGDEPFEVGRRAAQTAHTQATDSDGTGYHDLLRLLTLDGFEPTLDDDTITLANCPFAEVAGGQPGVICELHRGLLAGTMPADATVSLTPKPPQTAGCLVTVSPPSASSTEGTER